MTLKWKGISQRCLFMEKALLCSSLLYLLAEVSLFLWFIYGHSGISKLVGRCFVRSVLPLVTRLATYSTKKEEGKLVGKGLEVAICQAPISRISFLLSRLYLPDLFPSRTHLLESVFKQILRCRNWSVRSRLVWFLAFIIQAWVRCLSSCSRGMSDNIVVFAPLCPPPSFFTDWASLRKWSQLSTDGAAGLSPFRALWDHFVTIVVVCSHYMSQVRDSPGGLVIDPLLLVSKVEGSWKF